MGPSKSLDQGGSVRFPIDDCNMNLLGRLGRAHPPHHPLSSLSLLLQGKNLFIRFHVGKCNKRTVPSHYYYYYCTLFIVQFQVHLNRSLVVIYFVPFLYFVSVSVPVSRRLYIMYFSFPPLLLL